jgi:ketosteroid isomerase-like protein
MATIDPATERNRELVQRFLLGDFSLLAEDASIWLAAPLPLPPLSTVAAWVTRDQLIAMRDWLNNNGRTQYRIKADGITAEGRRVAVEAAGHIELESGDVYANQYHLVFEVDGDRITHMREYSDTNLVVTLFGDGRDRDTLPAGA